MVKNLEPHRAPVPAFGFVIFLLLALTLLFPYFEATRNANERPRLLQGMALVEQGEWAIDGSSSKGLDPGPDVARSRHDGRLYPNKPPGTTMLVAAAYRVARQVCEPLTLRDYTWWARLFAGVLPTIALAWFMLRRLARGFSRGPAVVAVVLYVLGSPANSYAHLAYGHQLAAACLVIGVGLLVDATIRADQTRQWAPTAALALVAGALCGAAVAVEYGAVFAGLPIALMLLWRARSGANLAVAVASLAGALIPIGALALYHDTVFGSPWTTGYHHVIDPTFAAKHGQGFLGLGLPRWDGLQTHFLSPDGGLLWWVPLLPLAVYGLIRLALDPQPDHRLEARVSLGLLGLYIVVTSSLSFDGGWRVGPRYMVVVLPVLAMGWAQVVAEIRTHALWIPVFVALSTYALVVNVLAANLWPHFDLANIEHPFPEVLQPLWEHHRQPYGLLRRWLDQDSGHLVMGGIVMGGLISFLRVIEVRARNLIAYVAGLGLGALSLAITAYVVPAHPRSAANLSYIERVWEPPPRDRSGKRVDGPSHRIDR